MTTKVVSCFVVVDSVIVVEKSLVPPQAQSQPDNQNYDFHIQHRSNTFLVDILARLRQPQPTSTSFQQTSLRSTSSSALQKQDVETLQDGITKTIYTWSSHKRLLAFTGYTCCGITVVCVSATPTRSLELTENDLKANIKKVENFSKKLFASFERFTSLKVKHMEQEQEAGEREKHHSLQKPKLQKSIGILDIREGFQSILKKDMQAENNFFYTGRFNHDNACCGNCRDGCVSCWSDFDCMSCFLPFLMCIGYAFLTDPERQHLVFDGTSHLWSIQEKSVLFVKFREKIKDKRNLLLAVRSFMNVTSEREQEGAADC